MVCVRKQSIIAKRNMVTTFSVYFSFASDTGVEMPLDLSTYQAYIIFRPLKTINDPDDINAVIDKQMTIATDINNNPIPGTMSVSLSEAEMSMQPGSYVGAVNLVNLAEAVGNRNSETLEIIDMTILQNINKVLP